MKKCYHFLLLIAALAFMTQAALGQTTGTLSGQVLDDKGAPLPYGTVALHVAASGVLLTGTAIDLEGKFQLKTPAPGKYLLRISALGFSTQDLPVFDITAPNGSKSFGTISLRQDSKVLKEVKVQGMRPTIDMQPDKMVMHVEGTALAAGNTAYEVLAKAPGVWIDQDGNIQLNGKDGVRVMIDGKLSYLSGKQLQTMLQAMPAENLKNLEIIANPSAKYDAEGTAGILNLNLKKNTLTGLNGSVYGGYQFNPGHGVNGGGTLNLKQGPWNSFATVDGASRPRKRAFSMDRTFLGEEGNHNYVMNGEENGKSWSPSFRIGTDYDLNKNHSIGGTFSMAQSTADSRVLTNTLAETGTGTSSNEDHSKYRSATFNAHYLGKLDSLGTTLSLDVDLVRINNRNQGIFQTQNGPQDTYLQRHNPTGYQIYSSKVDFTKPLPRLKGKVETGVKASYVRSDNQIDFYAQNGAPIKENDEVQADHFIFDENIYAGYVSLNTKLSSIWSLQTGLRAEYTSSEGNSLPTKQVTPRSYLDWFPSVFLQQKVTENYQVSYTYSRRINRPRYESLNPFVFFIDGNTSAQGNPYLKPQYTNSFQLTQTFKKSYNLTMGYARTKDAMSEVPIPNPVSKKIIFQQRNVRHETLNATLVAPVTVTSKWNVNNTLTLAYQNYQTRIEGQVIQNDQVVYMGQTNHNVQLPKGFRLEVSGAYMSDGVFNIYQTKANYWVDLGVKKSFMKDQLDVTLSASDLFKSRRMHGISTLNGNTNELNMYKYSQSLRLNLRYRFHKGEKFEAKRRNNTLDELNRAGGN